MQEAVERFFVLGKARLQIWLDCFPRLQRTTEQIDHKFTLSESLCSLMDKVPPRGRLRASNICSGLGDVADNFLLPSFSEPGKTVQPNLLPSFSKHKNFVHPILAPGHRSKAWLRTITQAGSICGGQRVFMGANDGKKKKERKTERKREREREREREIERERESPVLMDATLRG